MTNQVTNHSDHKEIMSLLPWFVNQTLEGHKRETVINHIENCDECQREIVFLTSLKETVKNDAQNKHNAYADVDKDLASVMNRIDAKSHSINTAASGVSWLRQKLSDVFNFSSILPIPQWSATAVAGLLVAVLGFQLFQAQSDNSYSVLSSADLNESSMRLSVEVTPAVTQQQALSKIQYKLEEIGQQVDIEAKLDGMYIIVFRDSISVTELSKLIADLEHESQIERVEILP